MIIGQLIKLQTIDDSVVLLCSEAFAFAQLFPINQRVRGTEVRDGPNKDFIPVSHIDKGGILLWIIRGYGLPVELAPLNVSPSLRRAPFIFPTLGREGMGAAEKDAAILELGSQPNEVVAFAL
jgi:hypothetical protein